MKGLIPQAKTRQKGKNSTVGFLEAFFFCVFSADASPAHEMRYVRFLPCSGDATYS